MMIIRLITVLLLFTCSVAHTQELFPDRITGRWTGMLHLWKNGQHQDSVFVILHVKSLGSELWQWKMEYKSAMKPMTKDYTIRLKDRSSQLFITDEGGGVELEDYVFGDRMMSMFETGDIRLTSTHEISGDHLIFQVTAGRKTGTLDNGLTNYSITSLQRAVLRRSSKETFSRKP